MIHQLRDGTTIECIECYRCQKCIHMGSSWCCSSFEIEGKYWCGKCNIYHDIEGLDFNRYGPQRFFNLYVRNCDKNDYRLSSTDEHWWCSICGIPYSLETQWLNTGIIDQDHCSRECLIIGRKFNKRLKEIQWYCHRRRYKDDDLDSICTNLYQEYENERNKIFTCDYKKLFTDYKFRYLYSLVLKQKVIEHRKAMKCRKNKLKITHRVHEVEMSPEQESEFLNWYCDLVFREYNKQENRRKKYIIQNKLVEAYK